MIVEDFWKILILSFFSILYFFCPFRENTSWEQCNLNFFEQIWFWKYPNRSLLARSGFCRVKGRCKQSKLSKCRHARKEIVLYRHTSNARIRKIGWLASKCRDLIKLQNVETCTRFWPDLIRYILNKIIFIYFSRLEYI